MPNSRLGAIDTIVGEKIELDFLNQIKQQNILNYNYNANIFIHENLFSFLENLNTISTYNLDIEEFSLINDIISNIDSHSFVSNALLVLDNNLLKAYNLENKKIFWQIDLSKELSDKDSIVQSFIYKDNIIIFFSKGIILQLDRLNAIGGFDAIVPSEGIVFKYKGKTYKFTGAFAPINQITGLIYF